MFMIIALLSILGLIISLYSYVTENKLKQDPTYKPACDISDRISCSKPLNSPYATLFYFSNSTLGILFYCCMMLAALFNASHIVLFLAGIGATASIFLAYLLYAKIKALCLVCTSLYIINFLLLYYAVRLIL